MLVGPVVFRRMCRARERLSAPDEADLSRSIEDVALEAVISPFHFIRLFGALFGVTPHQFRMRARLERAKALLSGGHHSVTDVCMEVGFSSLGSFSELFRRRVGVSPSAYQRRGCLVAVPGAWPPPAVPGCLGLMGRLPAGSLRNFREA